MVAIALESCVYAQGILALPWNCVDLLVNVLQHKQAIIA